MKRDEYGEVFFFNDTATTEIYTLSLHDALPILNKPWGPMASMATAPSKGPMVTPAAQENSRVPTVETICPGSTIDRKSTRLNSSHANISYAVFCLKKKVTRQCACHRPTICTRAP